MRSIRETTNRPDGVRLEDEELEPLLLLLLDELTGMTLLLDGASELELIVEELEAGGTGALELLLIAEEELAVGRGADDDDEAGGAIRDELELLESCVPSGCGAEDELDDEP